MKALDSFLKEQRKQARLTQLEFAERAGVALTVIRKIEQERQFTIGNSKPCAFHVRPYPSASCYQRD